MRVYQRFFLLTTLSAALQGHAKFEAHEWGTFTSLVGSNGITQNGMYHEDEALPDFVHGFGEIKGEQRFAENSALGQQENPSPPTTQPPPPPPPPRCRPRNKACLDQEVFEHNIVTQKMETPVIYFYSDQEQKVKVNVRFPEGVVTETYPAPVQTSPSSRQNLQIANGNTTFSIQVLPTFEGQIPYVDSENIYAHARNVKSNIVKSGEEQEKFIFYRGLGRFQPKLSIQSKAGALTLKATQESLPQAAFLVHVNEAGHGQMMPLGKFSAHHDKSISAQLISQLSQHQAQPSSMAILSGESSRQALLDSLKTAGLHTDEATAMLDTWENGYLKVPGLRLLYILPRVEVDQALPLTMTPAPENFARVFVGRIEILLDTEEQRILNTILVQGPQFQVQSLGRFAEPILRRLEEIAPASSAGLISSLVDKAAIQEASSAVH